MFTPQRNILIVLVLSFFFVAGCSMTSVTGTWKKSDYSGEPFTSIMVLGLTADPTHRLFWEDVMADRLQKDGIKTVVKSLSASPDDTKIDREELLDYVTSKGIQGVLVTRLVDTRKETVYHPPTSSYGYSGGPAYYRNFNSYFSYYQDQVYSPGYTTTQTVVLLETNLYQVKNQELIWSMTSDTVESQSIHKLMDSVSKKVLASLKKDQLI
jgi:hypothetical protein